MGHCFISYTNAKTEAEAMQFAIKLADKLKGEPPHIDVWIDNRSIQAGNWDEQVSEAIKNCKCLLFIATPDSVTNESICADEIDWALRYKKIVIPLLLYKDVEIPFRLSRRKFVDFTDDFETALSQLRNLIAWLDSSEGVLQSLKDRLADAQRDLRRNPENAPRIEKEIEELNTQIEAQQKIVDNPEAAAKQTQINIETGLERERHPEKPSKAQSSTKFINPPPGIAPNYFQDRDVETKMIVDFLNDDAQRLMTIVGRGGVGKTAMVCRLLKGLEGGELPDGLGKMRVEGIVYLSESGSHRVNFANLFYDLCKLLPSDAANELDAVYKNPQGSTESKMRALLEKFGGGRVVALLDNFEPLVDTETFAIRDAELDEALRAFLNGTHSAVKVVITTRVAPRALNLIQPGRQRGLTLDEGLESPYAENILREMDSDGRLGLKSAGAEALDRARIKTRGFPRALEALFAILASDRYTTLEELLAMPLPENVVEALVGEAFNRLDTNAQKVMQALAVYNRPVTPAAVDYLLAPHLPAMDSAPILQRLASMHFARKESGRFYLHPVDREFAFGLIGNGKSGVGKGDSSRSPIPNVPIPDSQFTQHDLTTRAADYFAQARKPRAEWKKLEDLSAQLEEFDLRCAAGDYDTAAKVLTEIDIDFLSLWGYSKLVLRYRLSLVGNINNRKVDAINHCSIGYSYRILGNYRETLKFLEQNIFQEEEIEYDWQGRRLSDIAHSYLNLGDYSKAMDYYNKALALARKNNNRLDEGRWLANIGSAKNVMKDHQEAKEILEEALSIARETNDLKGEGSRLEGLAHAYYKLGEVDTSIQFHEQSLTIARTIGDKRGEGIRLSSLGELYYELGKHQQAILYTQEALQIAKEMHDKKSFSRRLNIIARIYQSQGNKEEALLNYQEALSIATEIGDLQGQGIYLSNLGLLHHRIGKKIEAKGYFLKAIEIALKLNDYKTVKSRTEKLRKIEQEIGIENID